MAEFPAGPWYLPAERYWVEPPELPDHPPRQGDLFAAPDPGREAWHAALLTHPTCELVKAAVRRVQVVRVRRLDEIRDHGQRARVVCGFQEREGRLQVAFAHTFFLAPAPDDRDDEPLFADLRDIALVHKEQLLTGRRAALTHDGRVTLIRRRLYFDYRLNVPFEQVRRLEAARIAADPAFTGPRPAWAG